MRGDLAAAKQFNGGQACICPDYVFVKEQQKNGLVEEFRAKVKQNLYRDDGSIKKENIAQIVNDQNFARIKRLFDDAVAKGAKIAVGGTLEGADRTIHPTMLTDVTPDMLIMQEEIFGPIVPVLTYKNIDDVIEYISGRGKPLALYIYSNNRNNIDKILSRTSSGGVTINGFFSHYLENQLPFGGVNQSGMGSYHGVFGFKSVLSSSAQSTYRRIDRRLLKSVCGLTAGFLMRKLVIAGCPAWSGQARDSRHQRFCRVSASFFFSCKSRICRKIVSV